MGFVAVFAGATNTPIACTVMAVELFGAGPIVPVTYSASGTTFARMSMRLLANCGFSTSFAWAASRCASATLTPSRILPMKM